MVEASVFPIRMQRPLIFDWTCGDRDKLESNLVIKEYSVPIFHISGHPTYLYSALISHRLICLVDNLSLFFFLIILSDNLYFINFIVIIIIKWN